MITARPSPTASAKKRTDNRTRFTIQVFPHVKKFILRKFKLSNPIKSEEYSTFGKSITLALKDNRLRIEYNDSQYRNRLTETLTIVLTKEQSEFTPRIQKLMRINTAMDIAFKEHLLTWVDGQHEAGIPIHTACKMFLQFYDIDEKEYSLDAAYKHCQRKKD
jgi:hypothetical protein